MNWAKDKLAEMERNLTVVTNWDELKSCFFAEKRWVNPKDVDQEKSYEKGDFLRVWCAHDGDWCTCETGDCQVRTDHENE